MKDFELTTPDLRSDRVYSNLRPYNKCHNYVLLVICIRTYLKFDLDGSRLIAVLLGLGILALIYSCYYTILYQRYHSRCSRRPAQSTLPRSLPAYHRRMTRRWSSWLDLWWHSLSLGTLSCLLLLNLDRLNWQLRCPDCPDPRPRLWWGLWTTLGWKYST
jgi:hypothetical protein